MVRHWRSLSGEQRTRLIENGVVAVITAVSLAVLISSVLADRDGSGPTLRSDTGGLAQPSR